MKKILNIFSILSITMLLSSCFNDSKVIFNSSLVEFDAAVITAPLAGLTYPVIATTNNRGALTQKINLVAAQRTKAETITVVVDEAATTATIIALSKLPTPIIGIPAVAGLHYTLDSSGSFVIPEKTSSTNMTFSILAAPANAGRFAILVFTLKGNGTDIKPSENYKTLAYRIAL